MGRLRGYRESGAKQEKVAVTKNIHGDRHFKLEAETASSQALSTLDPFDIILIEDPMIVVITPDIRDKSFAKLFFIYILLVHFPPPCYIVSNSCADVRGMEATIA